MGITPAQAAGWVQPCDWFKPNPDTIPDRRVCRACPAVQYLNPITEVWENISPCELSES